MILNNEIGWGEVHNPHSFRERYLMFTLTFLLSHDFKT